ncbi:MAG: branched-chain amino acid ABC transporter ATP-binding protein/permease [Parvibaculaceae bacterium]
MTFTTALSRAIAIDAIPGAVLLAAIVALPCLVIAFTGSGAVTLTATNFLVMLVAVLGLSVFSGNSGIISFGNVAFMAVGAQVSATLTLPPAIKTPNMPLLPSFIHALQLDLWSATAITLVVVLVVALISGLALVRMSPTSASIATLGFLIIVNSIIVGAQGFTRGSQAMYGVPKLVGLPVAILLAVVAIIIARLYRDSTAGVRLRAGRDNDAAARACGIDVPAERLRAWVVGALLSGLAGIMFAHVLTVFSAKGFYFELTFSIIAMMVVGGMASVTGAVSGAVVVTLLIEILRRLENGFALGPLQVPQFFGLTQIGLSIAILAILYTGQTGLLGFREIDAFLPKAWRRRRHAAAAEAIRTRPEDGADSLAVETLSKSYGGLVAVDKVSLSVRRGEILGLIGPNGSGKTTLLGCIAGTHEATAGRVRLGNRDLTGRAPHEIARLGVGRTFQTVRLFANMTVLENVMAALADAERASSLDDLARKAVALLDEIGIAPLAGAVTGTLAYGQQRRVEIARAVAVAPAFLLLDEPTAGMNDAETQVILDTLKRLITERQIGLLIVDHDMKLIMSLCDRIAVLNKGQLIAEGTPEAIQGNTNVQEAYLGRRHARRAEKMRQT